MDVGKIADMLYNELLDTARKIGKAQGVKGLAMLVPMVIQRVEQARGDVSGLTGEQKRDVAVNVLNRFINVPVLPEFVEGAVIGFMVDAFVGFFNKRFGKSWSGVAMEGVEIGA